MGDDKYGDFDLNKRLQKPGDEAHVLHAWRLQFNHPPRASVQLIAELPPELGFCSHRLTILREKTCSMSAKNFRPRRFDLIAFDWDGTLFDSTAIIVRCIQAAVRDVGGTVPTDKEAAYVIGMGLMQALGPCGARCAAREVHRAGQPLPLSLHPAPGRPEPV